MLKRVFSVTGLLTITLLSSCEAVGMIFKAGYYAGIFAILAVLVLIVGLFYYIGRR